MSADFLTLHAFIAAAESGSFSKAAGKIGRSQSAVSQQIAKLESEAGKPLFMRGKDMRLTGAGETLLPYARQIMALHHEALDRLREPQLAGEVRFGLLARGVGGDGDAAQLHARLHEEAEHEALERRAQLAGLVHGEHGAVALEVGPGQRGQRSAFPAAPGGTASPAPHPAQTTAFGMALPFDGTPPSSIETAGVSTRPPGVRY